MLREVRIKPALVLLKEFVRIYKHSPEVIYCLVHTGAVSVGIETWLARNVFTIIVNGENVDWASKPRVAGKRPSSNVIDAPDDANR